MAKLLRDKDRCMALECEEPAEWDIADSLLCKVHIGKLLKGERVDLIDGSLKLGQVKRVKVIG
jgi:hypothetical protein